MKYEYRVISSSSKAALIAAGVEGWLVVSESEHSWTLMRPIIEAKQAKA